MKNTPSRTIVLVAAYFPPHAGGLERYAYEIARSLHREHKWRVVVITSGKLNGGDEKQEMDGLTVYRLGFSLKISNTPLGFLWFQKIRRILKEEKPDIVNVHTPVPGLGDIAALFTRSKDLVVTYHAMSMKKGRVLPDLLVWLYEHAALPLLLFRAKSIICSSNSVREEFLKAYKYKSMTITPGVDHKIFVPQGGERPSSTVLFVAADLSRACAYKGLPLLIEAIDAVKKGGINVSLAVVGDGDMRESYEAAVRARGLEGVVRFKGRLQGEKLLQAYQEASVFVLPTENDSYPLVILEAMAAGLPVIATTVGDIPTIVEEGKSGLLIAPRDREALVEKLLLLLGDPKKATALGSYGRRKAVKEFSWQERAARYNTLFLELKTENKYIVHVSAYYPPHMGGIERVVKNAAELLAQRGMNTVVLTSSGSFTTRVMRGENLVVKKLASLEFAHTPLAPGLLWHLLGLPSNSIMHLHLAQAYWPDIVRLTSFIRGIPYIVHFHLDVGPSGHLGKLFLLYKRLTWGSLLRGAESVIVCSREHVAIVQDIYGVAASKITVIPNAVGENFFSERAHALPKEQFHLLYIGRLAPQKRLERLLRAFTLLTVPAHLTIVGEGEERSALMKFAEDHNLTNVSFVGAKDDTEMQRYHKMNDAFLIASEREGAPLAVLEAMASGLPIIGSNVEGIRELLDGVGVLVNEPYPSGFARAIEALWGAPKRLGELSKASTKKARQYTWERFIAELEGLYQKLPS